MVLDFRGDGLLSVLDLKPYVVKPNREELGQTVGRSLDDDADLLAAMRELNRLGAQWVVVTQGAKAVWVSSSEQCLSSRAAAGCRGRQSDRLRRLPGRRHRLGDAPGRLDRRCGASWESARRPIIWASSCPAGWSGRTWRTWRAESRSQRLSGNSPLPLGEGQGVRAFPQFLKHAALTLTLSQRERGSECPLAILAAEKKKGRLAAALLAILEPECFSCSCQATPQHQQHPDRQAGKSHSRPKSAREQ